MSKNRNNKMVIARKNYTCDCCNQTIKIGDKYHRLNIKNKGIFHFCYYCKTNRNEHISNYLNTDELDYEYHQDLGNLRDAYYNEF